MANKFKPSAKPPVLSRFYLDDSGQRYVHQELPSVAWEPMRRDADIPYREGVPLECWSNCFYECSVRRYASGFPLGDSAYVVLGITHVSQRAIHDWRDMMRIKNDICGESWEGLELYPAESRCVDPSNRFYLFCVPPGVITWGLPGNTRHVVSMRDSIAPQRPFPEERHRHAHSS